MKKTVSIILALIISASAAALAGCGSKKQAEQPMPAVQSNVTSAQESNETTAEETTQQGTTAMSDEAAKYKPYAQKLLDYVGKYVDMSLYSTEENPGVGFFQFYFSPKSEIKPVMDPIVPEIELPGVVTVKLGMQYKELQALGFQNPEWDHSECVVDTFNVSVDSTGSLWNYHGITGESTIEDIVKILGTPDLKSNVLIENEFRGEIKLVYNNHDDKKMQTVFKFEYEFSTDKVTFKELQVQNYRP